jgi:hypothetical protein
MISTGKITPSLALAASLLTLTSPASGAATQASQPVPNSLPRPSTPPSRSEMVWVNTASGYYHKPNSRHYGKTKRGKYMTEPDAIQAGCRPARN